MSDLYPPIEPYASGYLRVSSHHELYYEECGNKEGIPILFLHGGPGSGIDPNHRRFFNPKRFRIVLFDQRGAGKSRPYGSLIENTTAHLVEDIELLRKTLKIERWHVFGGSWGSTLALCYAIKHSSLVQSLILRGIFLARKQDIDWFFVRGANAVFPEEWEKFLEILTDDERKNPLHSYYRIFLSQDEKRKDAAAKAWIRWEGIALQLKLKIEVFQNFATSEREKALSYIECHYFQKGCFFEENYILKEAHKIESIPTVIVHGRYDMICPFDNAWALKNKLNNAKLLIAETSGHSAMEQEIASLLVDATDSIK